MMRRKFQYLLMLLIMAVFVSCERMELYDIENTMHLDLKLKLKLDIKVDIDIKKDLDIDIEDSIRMPEHNKVLFYSPSSASLMHTEFVDSTGGNISTPPGTYDMLVYSFGTEYVQIRGESSIKTIEAFTSDITATKSGVLRSFTRDGEEEPPGPIIYPPDHLLVASEKVEIHDYTDRSYTATIHAEANTIVKTYTFEVNNIEGFEYIEKCEAFVTNQSRSSFFGIGEISSEPATLSFPVGVSRKKKVLYTTFNTFGKLPGESRSYLYILITDTGGQEHRVETDITDQFVNEDHRIIINKPIVVPEPPSHGGGISPSVNPWDEENQDVPIG